MELSFLLRLPAFAVLFCFAAASEAQSNETPSTVSDAANDHYFLSATSDYTSEDYNGKKEKRINLHHEVCNISGSRSALIWEKAGFALDTLNQLEHLNCARLTRFGVEEIKSDLSTVTFQGGASDSVETIFQCHHLLGVSTCEKGVAADAVRAAMSLSLLMQRPDEINYRLETINVSVVYGDGVSNLRVRTSDGVEDLAFAFDPNLVDLDLLRAHIPDSDTIEVNTFTHFLKSDQLTSGFLTELFDPDTPVIFFRKAEETSADFFEQIRRLGALGEAISLLVTDDGEVVAVSQLLVPPVQ